MKFQDLEKMTAAELLERLFIVTGRLDKLDADVRILREVDVIDVRENFPEHKNREWYSFQADWFFQGLRTAQITHRDDFSQEQRTLALTLLNVIQRSWEPRHEHKTTLVAYLASRWLSSYDPEVAHGS